MNAENVIFSFLRGKHYSLSGVSGVFQHDDANGHLLHIPDAAGRKSQTYRDLRRRLGDDWETDMTYSERIGDIALELGFDPKEYTP